MAKTISTFKSELQRKLRGTSLARVADPYSTIGEAAANLLATIDPAETVRVAQITNALHDDVYDYAAPSDLKGNKIIDLRPQVSREIADNATQKYIREFDQYKASQDDIFNVYYKNGTKLIRISKDISPAPTVIEGISGVATNGMWAVGDDADTLTADTQNYITGNASLNFNITASAGSGYIENSTMTAVNLTNQDETGTVFAWVYLPVAANITNLILRWGNDSSNYWSRTVTTPHVGSFENGWNLVAFAWNGATETGTVDPSAIDYLRFTVTTATTDTDFRLDSITVSNGEIWEVVYYSKYLFQNSGGTWLEAPTADTDTINLDTDSYNILLYEAASIVAQEVGGQDAQGDFQYYYRHLHGDGAMIGLYDHYKEGNISEAKKPKSTYYRV